MAANSLLTEEQQVALTALAKRAAVGRVARMEKAAQGEDPLRSAFNWLQANPAVSHPLIGGLAGAGVGGLASLAQDEKDRTPLSTMATGGLAGAGLGLGTALYRRPELVENAKDYVAGMFDPENVTPEAAPGRDKMTAEQATNYAQRAGEMGGKAYYGNAKIVQPSADPENAMPTKDEWGAGLSSAGALKPSADKLTALGLIGGAEAFHRGAIPRPSLHWPFVRTTARTQDLLRGARESGLPESQQTALRALPRTELARIVRRGRFPWSFGSQPAYTFGGANPPPALGRPAVAEALRQGRKGLLRGRLVRPVQAGLGLYALGRGIQDMKGLAEARDAHNQIQALMNQGWTEEQLLKYRPETKELLEKAQLGGYSQTMPKHEVQ